jgi:hypothetical protein
LAGLQVITEGLGREHDLAAILSHVEQRQVNNGYIVRYQSKLYQIDRNDVRAGFEAVDRGEFTDYDESNVQGLAERVKIRGRKRLADEERVTGTR